MEIEISGERAVLLPERAVYLPSTSTLLVADLHWGKTEVFNRAGIAMPAGLLTADLNRLQRALEKSGAARVIVLGDLVHNARVLPPNLHAEIVNWRRANPVPILLVPGNHDRGLMLHPDWNVALGPAELKEGPFLFCHQDPPKTSPGVFAWTGHIHPMMRISGRNDTLRCPCFVIGRTQGWLPAFSQFTGGHDITPKRSERIFVVADDEIIGL